MSGWWIAVAVLAVAVGAGAASLVLTSDGDPPPEAAFEGRFGGDANSDGIRDGSLTPEAAADGPEADHLIVSVGDSVASGEGNPDRAGDFPTRPARWLLRRCHRSLRSGHAEAALAVERGDSETDVAFVPLACSGATIEAGLLHAYRGIQPDRGELFEPPQVDRVNTLAERREIDALLVSVGANDVNFSSIVKFCLRVDRCWERRFDPERPFAEAPRGAPSLVEVTRRALRELPDRYAALEARLSRRIPRERVLIVEYFDPTVGRDGSFCEMEALGRITPAESEWAHEHVLQPLNATVRRAAGGHDWTLVEGVDELFEGHGICIQPASERWVRTLTESLHQQNLDFAGTLHPNGLGHVATAGSIAPALAELLE